MAVTIHTIPLGIENVYVVKDKGAVIIDGGAPKKGKRWLEKSSTLPATPQARSAFYWRSALKIPFRKY